MQLGLLFVALSYRNTAVNRLELWAKNSRTSHVSGSIFKTSRLTWCQNVILLLEYDLYMILDILHLCSYSLVSCMA
jgi:hypothetical protein